MARLAERLARRIAAEGPMTVAEYMDACLHDSADGYYAVRPALGAEGDFLTAPHVSQMFGELLGLWAAEVWVRLGAPPRVRLVELGPGDGTLMADALRAARAVPGFLAAAELVLVETSAPLRERQGAALAGFSPHWAAGLDGIGTDRPVIILANEFLDCLPIRQAVRTADGWRERRIGRCGFVAAEPVSVPIDGPLGAIFEWSPAVEAVGRDLRALLAEAGGAAVFIDYGRTGPEFADTLQAVRGHAKECPLADPGHADLTAHVDFAAFAPGACVMGQGEFLRALGIEARAAALAAAHPAEAAKIARQLARLIAPDQMGKLFKAVALTGSGLAAPGFEA